MLVALPQLLVALGMGVLQLWGEAGASEAEQP